MKGRRKLLRSFLIYAVIFMFIPLGAIAIAYYNTYKQELVKRYVDDFKYQSSIVSHTVSSELEICKQKLYNLLFDEDIGTYFERDYTLPGYHILDGYYDIQNVVFNTLNLDADFYSIYFFTQNTALVENYLIYPFSDLEQQLTQEQLQALFRFQIIPSIHGDQIPSLTLTRIIANESTTKFKTAICIDIPLQSITSKLEVFKTTPGYWYALTGNDGQSVFISNLEQRDHAVFEKIKNFPRETGVIETSESVCFFYPFTGNSSRLILTFPKQEIYKLAQDILISTGAIASCAIILMTIFTIMAYKTVFKRLYAFIQNLNCLDLTGNGLLAVKDDREDELSDVINKINSIIYKNYKLSKEQYETNLKLSNTEKLLLSSQIAVEKLEYKLLQSQINPHFLHNILTSIKNCLATSDTETIKEIIDTLVQFYKLSLSKGRSVITIQDEITLASCYVKLEQFIHHDFECIFEIDERVYPYQCPKFLLQPIIENAIKHAFVHEEKDWMILVGAELNQDTIVFTISDNGIGFSQEQLNERVQDHVGGFGLNNVIERLRIFYKDQYNFKIDSQIGAGTQIVITVPTLLEDPGV